MTLPHAQEDVITDPRLTIAFRVHVLPLSGFFLSCKRLHLVYDLCILHCTDLKEKCLGQECMYLFIVPPCDPSGFFVKSIFIVQITELACIDRLNCIIYLRMRAIVTRNSTQNMCQH